MFVNGLPLGLIELKNPANEVATLKKAFTKIGNYRSDILSVFTANAVTVISDGTSAAMSSFTGGFEHYAPCGRPSRAERWSPTGRPRGPHQGVFDRAAVPDLVRNFIVFSDETVTDPATGQKTRALIAGSPSTTSIGWSTLRWSPPWWPPRTGTAAAGGVAHPGSGKSLEMVFTPPR